MASKQSVLTPLRSIRRFIIGPWPIHALVVWALMSVFVAGIAFRFIAVQNPLIPQSTSFAARLTFIVTYSIFGPGLVLVPLIIYQRLRKRLTERPVTAIEYLLSLLLASCIAAALLEFTPLSDPVREVGFDSPGVFTAIGRFFVQVWFFNALMGAFLERIRLSSQVAQDALKVVTHQRRLLLESEERVRGQVATYLHDRVQTDLVSIGLRIRAIIYQSPEDIKGPLSEALSEIERVRSQEVRRASRHLSPDIQRIGLETALRELADAYRPGMSVTIVLAESFADRPASESASTQAAAVYRICEQGLLNAAVHGHASECSIVVSESQSHQVVLELRDNGVGSPHPTPEPGTGMTVISAWVESLHGEWSLTSTGSGMLLSASLPQPSADTQD
jgi:signal transduction histidine kinase